MKTRVNLFFLVFLLAFCFSSCHNVRKVYSVKDKIDSSDSSGNSASCSVAYVPGIDLGIQNADLICQGEIVSEGSKVFVPLFSDGEYEELGFCYYRYDFTIDEIWFGECSEETIPLYLPENCAQLQKNDLAMFFLRSIESYGNEDYYRPVNMERSFFVINPPDDTLYSLDVDEGCSKYDGRSPLELKADIQTKIAEFAAQNMGAGKVIETYKENNVVDK